MKFGTTTTIAAALIPSKRCNIGASEGPQDFKKTIPATVVAVPVENLSTGITVLGITTILKRRFCHCVEDPSSGSE